MYGSGGDIVIVNVFSFEVVQILTGPHGKDATNVSAIALHASSAKVGWLLKKGDIYASNDCCDRLWLFGAKPYLFTIS
jgi:hypothetical protein